MSAAMVNMDTQPSMASPSLAPVPQLNTPETTVVRDTDGPAPPMQPDGPSSQTAYPATEAGMRTMLADAQIDSRSFERRIARCSLAACRGMCCYDGVFVSDEEATVIEALAR
jgi:hypothetical protein